MTAKTWAFVIGGIVVVLGLALAGGKKTFRSVNGYRQWRATGKGMLQDWDKQRNDIDKYMR